jgi:hypothetical protein
MKLANQDRKKIDVSKMRQAPKAAEEWRRPYRDNVKQTDSQRSQSVSRMQTQECGKKLEAILEQAKNKQLDSALPAKR